MFRSKEEQFDFYWKEIFTGLGYNPIEFNTYRFDQTMSLPGKVNKLYDMFKVLAMNNQEVMTYLKEFVETFDEKLYQTIDDILSKWLEDGILTELIRNAINEEVVEARNDYSTLKERLDSEKADVNTQLSQTNAQLAHIASQKLDIKDFGGVGDGITDDTIAIQTLFNTAGSEHEAVLSKGRYYVTSEVTFKTTSKIKFDGGVIITDNTFGGEAVFRCNSKLGESGGNGYMLNPRFESIDERTNATALIFDRTEGFKVNNLVTKGYIKGGLIHESGFELFLNGFTIVAPNDLTTRAFPLLQAGLQLNSTDCEISHGAVICYPVGLITKANNSFSHIHNWGRPSTGKTTDTGVTLYPFITTEKGNNFVNCFADTPDVLNITLNAGEQNGGIGFLDGNNGVIPNAYPTQNSYVNCRVYRHPDTTPNKVIGFAFGDPNKVESFGLNTKIIAPTFQGGGFSENIKCYYDKMLIYATIIDENPPKYNAPVIVQNRVENLIGGYKKYGDRVFIQLSFTSNITGVEVIALENFPISNAFVRDSALSCVCLDGNSAIYARVSTDTGYLYASLESGKNYAISGWYSMF